ncbi:unnamed protein product [Schistosoma mattheei]|uniref:Uncharacterized protein n=1 Tax=Schistosoma mattheei TaxID=31246 RepID=A0A183NLN7_9TREM|nr:unnamed protein product [Schistosoma mattheei]
MIGIYGGNTKPAEFSEFSANTISEIKEMTDVGLSSVKPNKCIAFRLVSVICDSPARSVLDPMHIVYLGVTKELANLWIDLAQRRLLNLNSCAFRDINNLISGCVASTPSDYLRKCRTLDFVSAWKASECRLFLPYIGPVILQKTLPQPLYINFRRLSLSIYLLAHPKLHNTVVESAKTDLQNFVKEYEWCYGSENLVYNMHSLQHLPDYVRTHGPLDSFSAFPFESYMRQIKDSVHSGFAVAKQAAQRYAEKKSFCDRSQRSC